MGVDPNWTRPFRYCLGLDTAVLKPLSDSRAWQMKQRAAIALERILTSSGNVERRVVLKRKDIGGVDDQ